MCEFCQRCSFSNSRCPDPKYEKASLEKIHADLKQWLNVRQYMHFFCLSFFSWTLVLSVRCVSTLSSILCLLCLTVLHLIHQDSVMLLIQSHHLVSICVWLIITSHPSLSSQKSYTCPPLALIIYLFGSSSATNKFANCFSRASHNDM